MTEHEQQDQPQKAGTVIHLDGHAHAIRMDEGLVRLSLGVAIRSGDVVETDSGSQLTVLFSDGSELMLGASTRFSLDSFEFSRARRHSRLDAWVLEGAFVYSCGMVSESGAAVFHTRKAKIHVSNGKIVGKTDPHEQISMFTLLEQNGGYVGSASLIADDSAVMLNGANDTSIVSDETGQPSEVIKLTDDDLSGSYRGLLVGAWQNAALEKMSPENLEKQEAAASRAGTAKKPNSLKSA